MGPNPLWLLEELCEHLDLTAGHESAGHGLRQGVDLHLPGEGIWRHGLCQRLVDQRDGEPPERFEEAGVADLVLSHPLRKPMPCPLPMGSFDAAIAIDSYQYFGADEMYFPCTFSKLVKPGGQFGIVVPGLTREFEKGYPETLKEHWVGEMFSFHSKGIGGGTFGKRPKLSRSQPAMTWKNQKQSG